jgi:hypothetical protein
MNAEKLIEHIESAPEDDVPEIVAAAMQHAYSLGGAPMLRRCIEAVRTADQDRGAIEEWQEAVEDVLGGGDS